MNVVPPVCGVAHMLPVAIICRPGMEPHALADVDALPAVLARFAVLPIVVSVVFVEGTHGARPVATAVFVAMTMHSTAGNRDVAAISVLARTDACAIAITHCMILFIVYFFFSR